MKICNSIVSGDDLVTKDRKLGVSSLGVHSDDQFGGVGEGFCTCLKITTAVQYIVGIEGSYVVRSRSWWENQGTLD